MGRVCTICTHPERDAIDAALASGTAYSVVARQFEVGPESVRRHHGAHLSPALAAMEAAQQETDSATALDRVTRLIGRVERVLDAAESEGKSGGVLSAAAQLRPLIELLAKLTHELDDRPQVTLNLMASEEYIAVRSAIFAALMQFPDARAEVAGRLLQLEAGSS